MSGAGQVPFVGLTGGVGSGKSTALAALEELGAATLSADAVVHELLGSEEMRDAIVSRFGSDVLGADGAIERSAVAERVFGQAEDRSWLEGLLWPRVGARIVEWRAEVDASEALPPAAVVEVPLLFESGMDSVFDTTIAVVADEPLRAERAYARGHTAVAERVGRQLTQQEKADRAGYVVRNDGTREELKAELSHVLATIED
ncbi:MAG TPA: dephospho-CoA kinase [Thermoleophilaceae bacterium]|nr:dephospho-CoA kinase [Thermoleophilaceae bacterium]